MDVTTVPLDCLRYGHEEDHDIDARTTGRAHGLSELKASLDAHGLIQPLAVMQELHGLYIVIDGNRRLSAIRALADEGRWDQRDIAVIVRTPAGDARAKELSLAANVVRVPLHPIDQYEAFAGLAAAHMSEPDIAASYGITLRQVRQHLALGGLAPKIREAWRAGKIDAAVARTFTLTSDQARQERIFDKLSKRGGMWDYAVRKEIAGEQHGADMAVRFVGIDAYRAAGGTVMEDLFGDDHAVSDPALAQRLMTEKIKAECERLVADGWAWAEARDGLPNNHWSWNRSQSKSKPTDEEAARIAAIKTRLGEIHELDEESTDPALNDEYAALERELHGIEDAVKARGFSARQKAGAGCVLSVSLEGLLNIDYGRIKPKAAKEKAKEKKKRDAGGGDDDTGTRISNALAHRLSIQLSEAAAAAIEKDPDLALDVLLAAIAPGYVRPVRISVSGLRGASSVAAFDSDFDDRLAVVRQWTPEEKRVAIGKVAAAAIDLTTHNASQPPMDDEDVAALVNLIDPGAMRAALIETFDAEDYFGSVSTSVARAAYAEMTGKTLMASAKKAEVASMAAARAKETGWLPAELRTAHYDGPGAAKAGQEAA